MIDIAIIQVGRIVEKRDDQGRHRTIREANKMDTGQQMATIPSQGGASAGRKTRTGQREERLP